MLGPFLTKTKEAASPLTPGWRLAELAADADRVVRSVVAANPAASAEVLAGLFRRGEVRRALARNPSTPADVLTALADGADWELRRVVAGNRSTPAETLALLSRDVSGGVKEAVVMNPSTPPYALTTLAGDHTWGVRRLAANNPNTPPEAFAILAADESLRDGRAPVTRPLSNRGSQEAAAHPPTPPADTWATVVAPFGTEVEKVAWGLVREGFDGSLADLVAVVVGAVAE